MSYEILKSENVPFITLTLHNIKPRNNYYIEYCYPNLKIGCIIEGKAKWRIDNIDYDVEKNDIFIFNNKEKRALHTVTSDLSMIFVEFEPRFIWNNGIEILDSSYLNIFFNRNGLLENRIRDNEFSKLIIDIILEIKKEFNLKQPEYEQMLKIKVLNLLIILSRYYKNNSKNNGEIRTFNKENINLINKVMNFIDQHISEELTLEKLADIAHLNPSYLSTIFKQYNGITLFQYIQRKRISLSIDYLKNTHLSVLNIANICGFNTAANFYKYFKKLTGKIPKDFRTL